MRTLLLCLLAAMAACSAPAVSEVLVEAESFTEKGGWVVDQQFTHIMGSPYLLAHGLGVPVQNAKTKVKFPREGSYRLWVRTKDWVPGKWEPPGRFQVIVDGKTAEAVFGTEAGWNWQDGGMVEIKSAEVEIELKDLTGFDGRCDALLFTTAKDAPPNALEAMRPWRDRLLGIPETPLPAGQFDVVIVGGGIAGCGAALAADRQGVKVALIQDRPVFGGNASSEVRVHTIGIYGRGEDILKGIDTALWKHNGSADSIQDDAKRHRTMDAAKNVHQFLGWRAYGANMEGNRIVSIDARNIETSEVKRFFAPVFIDATGDGWVGYWAGAEYRYGREGRDEHGEAWDKHGDLWSPEKPDKITMGTSVLWNTERRDQPVPFPEVPWALDVAKGHAAIDSEWYWEYASADKNQIYDAEFIRDHMLRAIYGSFCNAKKDPKNANVALKWVAYVGGKRESRRLMGDYLYTQKDIMENRRFEDEVVEETRDIDVHYQRKLTGTEQDFLSKALFRKTGGKYYIPFRCFYSKNIENLMMAGRCFSATHVALGGPRIMRTCGQMGIATGFAAYLCKKHKTDPRGVGKDHIRELRALIEGRPSGQ